MHNPTTDRLGPMRQRARAALERDDVIAAERDFSHLLEQAPSDAEALQFLAARHLSRGDAARAIEMLGAVSLAQPDNGAVWYQLGSAQMAAGDFAAAAESLQCGLQRVPQMFVARLRLGISLQQLGHENDALVAYFSAINSAQAQGRWLSDQTTPPGMREAVKYAMNYVDVGRHDLFDAVIEPLRQRHGAGALGRVEHALAIYLGEQPLNLPDTRQKPKFLYFPDVPSQTYYAQDRFPWHRDLEAATQTIREELSEVLHQGADNLEPFLGTHQPEALYTHLSSTGSEDARWDAFFFYRHGDRYDDHCRRCPKTIALLDSMPMVRIREHGPEALFSVLRPGTHILPHRGVTNTRLVTHLPLIVPSDCAIKVGGEDHVWQEGQCVTFDDTFEHEAWNDSDQTRVVLIVDSWNPDLTEVEQQAVSDLVASIGDFNRACEVPDQAV